MDATSSLQLSLMHEKFRSVQALYMVAPPAFKDSPEFYRVLRATDKAKLYMEGDMEGLIEMEREDTHYWRQRYLAATSSPASEHIHINIASTPADCAQRHAQGQMTPLSLEQNVILNPEDESETTSPILSSGASSVSIRVESVKRPTVALFGLTATPNMGPILPSPLRSTGLIYDGVL